MSFGFRNGAVVVKWVVSVVVVLLGVIAIWVFWVTRDIAPPDDSDLLPVRREVADEDNAYLALLTGFELLVHGDSEEWSYLSRCSAMLSGREPWDAEFVDEALSTNAAYFAALESAIALPAYQSPLLESFDCLLPCLSDIMKAAKMLRLQSEAALKCGDIDRAARYASLCFRLGDMQSREPAVAIEYLVASACRSVGLQGYLSIARTGVPLEQIRQYQVGDGGWRHGTDVLVGTLRADYGFLKRAMLDLGQAPVEKVALVVSCYTMDSSDGIFGPLKHAKVPRVVFQPGRSVALLAAGSRALIRDARLPAWERSVEPFSLGTLESVGKLDRIRNPVGYILADMGLSSGKGVFAKNVSSDVVAQSIEMVAALHAYRRVEGELPESLDALVPAYLEVVPVDLFDGEPMKYDGERGIVYSVGRDREDNGGAYDEEQTRSVSHGLRGEDLVILIDEAGWGTS